MPSLSRITRLAFGAAAAVLLAALFLNLEGWLRSGVSNWPAVADMCGLLVITITGAIDPPLGIVRVCLTVVSTTLIFFGSLFIFVLR